jgi:hypothetical protein
MPARMLPEPAPPDIATRTYLRGDLPKMFARLFSGQTVSQAIAWAPEELEGFVR